MLLINDIFARSFQYLLTTCKLVLEVVLKNNNICAQWFHFRKMYEWAFSTVCQVKTRILCNSLLSTGVVKHHKIFYTIICEINKAFKQILGTSWWTIQYHSLQHVGRWMTSREYLLAWKILHEVMPLPSRTVARKFSIGRLCFCAGGSTFPKSKKNSTNL